MKIPFKWLCEWLQAEDPLPLCRVVQAIEQLGIEVESISDPTALNRDLVTVRVERCFPFEQRPELQVAEIFDGSTIRTVITKASNCKCGLIAIFAPVGSCLANGLHVREQYFGSIRSEGMLCGGDEIGLLSDGLHLVELPHHFVPGQAVADWLADPVLELAITPNLGHCLSISGLAREVARLLRVNCHMPSLPASTLSPPAFQNHIKVCVEDEIPLTISWCQITCHDSSLPSSPSWLKKRLWQCGHRSVNLIVDATNYVMLEMGQPIHAYDLDTLGTSLSFSRQGVDCNFEILDGTGVCATDGDIVALTQSGQIAALAGIVGSAATQITVKTRSALIESACFPSKDIQRTSRRLGVLTEASKRMERGVDALKTSFALKRVCTVLCHKALSSSKVITKSTQAVNIEPILCRLEKTNALLGLSMNRTEFGEILKKCALQPSKVAGGFLCYAPSHRFDLNCEVDLIAEIVRYKGLKDLPCRQSNWSNSGSSHDLEHLFQDRLRKRCYQSGFTEILSDSLIGKRWINLAGENALWKDFKQPLAVKKPKSAEHQYLRTGLLASFLQTLSLNFQRGNRKVRIFELARIYCEKTSGELCEQSALALLASASDRTASWSKADRSQDFYEMKGEVENLLSALGIVQFEFSHLKHLHFHPFRAALLHSGTTFLGVFGQIHPSLINQLGLGADEIFFCQLLPQVLSRLSRRKLSLQPVVNFPASQRDWTLTLSKDFTYHQLQDLIPSRNLLISVNLLGVYKSEELGLDRKNLTLRFCYRDDHRTLLQREVDQEHASVIGELQQRLGAHLLETNPIS